MVRVRQLWAGGQKVDRQTASMQGGDAVIGHVVIAVLKDERYASLVKYETAVPPSPR